MTPSGTLLEPSRTPKSSFAPQLTGRIPSLDGLRAVSILLVVAGHSFSEETSPRLFDLFGHLGNYGVRIFFLISGFLITTLLLKEHSKTNTISLPGFYTRRALRIFPAFYAYVAVVCVLALLGLVTLMPGDLLHAVTYTMNYHTTRGRYLNHIWSLAVEEQIYLIWPATVLLAGPLRAPKIALATIILAPLFRTGMYWYGAHPTTITRHFQAVADALASGCLLACLYNWMGTVGSYVAAVRSRLFVVIPGLLLIGSAAFYKMSPGLFYVLGQSVANVGIFLLLDHCVRFPNDWLGKILNWRPLAMIGWWSYSIYLWQELFLDHSESPNLGIPVPLNIICTFVVSIFSYYLVEQRFLKLKDRIGFLNRPDKALNASPKLPDTKVPEDAAQPQTIS